MYKFKLGRKERYGSGQGGVGRRGRELEEAGQKDWGEAGPAVGLHGSEDNDIQCPGRGEMGWE